MGRVKAQMSSISSHVADETRLFAYSFQLDLEEGTGGSVIVQQVLFFNHLPYLSVVQKLSEVDVLLE